MKKKSLTNIYSAPNLDEYLDNLADNLETFEKLEKDKQDSIVRAEVQKRAKARQAKVEKIQEEHAPKKSVQTSRNTFSAKTDTTKTVVKSTIPQAIEHPTYPTPRSRNTVKIRRKKK